MVPLPLLGFGMPGYQEMMLILIVGLLIFGRRLPEVGRAVGKTVTEFRKGLRTLKDTIGEDEDFREVGSAMQDFKQALDAPHRLADPVHLFDQLTDESMASAAPEEPRSSDQGSVQKTETDPGEAH